MSDSTHCQETSFTLSIIILTMYYLKRRSLSSLHAHEISMSKLLFSEVWVKKKTEVKREWLLEDTMVVGG